MTRNIKWTEERISEFELEGRGKGAGPEYKPWIQINDFSSRGFSRRIFSRKTNRVHQLLSEVEYQLFLLLEFSPSVVDIREQYPLNREQTLSLATQHGIRHPTYRGTYTPAVMTCDFLVILEKNGQRLAHAFNCKRAEGVQEARNIEKLELERIYFKQRDVPHHLVFDIDLPKQKIRNLIWCRGASICSEDGYDPSLAFDEYRQHLINDLSREPTGCLAEFCARYDRLLGAETGTGLSVVRAMLWRHELETDLSMPDLAAQPIQMFRPASGCNQQPMRG
ncbi:TnsA endonuclease N-terminal domain-containing protein [Azonexus sp. IMCC34839]|uniref:TnsA endonuclease N-terminal domain-containing protein n=1 Tax=Azonexus sp. IMCC34839 TaxID=3133695 RepID=UPI00399BF045